MGKIFSCHFENCDAVFTKNFDLKKHIVEHEDPSKLLRCTECIFVTLYPRNLRIHRNTHLDIRPLACPDMVIDGSSSTEIPCSYSANCTSALLKHRKKYHGYVPNSNRPLEGASASTSQVDCQAAPVSHYDSLPVPPQTAISGNHWASYSAEDSNAHAYPSVTSSSSMGQPFDSQHYSPPGTSYGEVSDDNSCVLTATSTDANSSVASQDNYFHHGVTTTLPFPILPNNPAAVLCQNSFYYVTNNAVVTSNDVAHTFHEPPYDATSLTWQTPRSAAVESTDSGAVTSYTANSYVSELAGSHVVLPPSPAELPFDDTVRSETDSLYSDASYGNEYIGTPAAEPIGPNPSVASQNNYAEPSDTFPAPSPLPVQPVLPDDDYSVSGATETVHSFSDLETEIHEDEIFFRGTGREGCLCPEMMINAGVDGWDMSLFNTHQEYSFA